MEMYFLPFPRGTTAQGTPDGKMVVAAEFLNKKGQPLLDVLKPESELAQVLIGTEFLNNAVIRCLKAKKPGCKGALSIGKNLSRGVKFGLFDGEPLKALKAIRDIRNAIAHADFAIKLVDKEVMAQMEILQQWLEAEQPKWQMQTTDGTMIPGWAAR